MYQSNWAVQVMKILSEIKLIFSMSLLLIKTIAGKVSPNKVSPVVVVTRLKF